MPHSGQGIVRDNRGEEQPADKARAQAAHETKPDGSVSKEATRDSKLDNTGNTAKPDESDR